MGPGLKFFFGVVVLHLPERRHLIQKGGDLEQHRTFSYQIGMWHVEAQVQHVDETKRLIIILATAGESDRMITSHHTVVYEHKSDTDDEAEIAGIVQRVISNAH